MSADGARCLPFRLSLALLSKFNAVGLLVAYGVAISLVHPKWRSRLAALGGAMGAVAAVDGWWFLRSAITSGDPTGMIAANRALGGGDYRPLRLDAARIGVTGHNLEAAMRSFFAVFGAANIDAPAVFFAVPAFLAVIGLAAGLLLARGTRALQLPAIWTLVTALELAGYSYIGPGNGRYLFPAITSIALLVVVGWDRILRRVHVPKAGWLLTGGPLALAVAAPLIVVRPAFARPAVLDALPATARQVAVTFDGAVELIGVEAWHGSVRPGFAYPLTLYWQMTGAAARQLNTFVHVESSAPDYRPGARYEGVIGHGAYPPNFWRPGQIVVDRYRLLLAPDTRSDKKATVRLSVRVGMYLAPRDLPIQKVATHPAYVADTGYEVAAWTLRD